MGRDSATSLAPGFRFHPTDEELVRFYLKRKVTGKSFRLDPIGVVDIYKSEPWDLPCQSKLKTRDLEWYFFSALDKKYGNGSRTNRATEKGYWKTTGKDRPVRHGSRTVGMKKTLVYHSGRAPRGDRTNWVMHEYKLVDEELARAGTVQDAFVLCRIFQKSGPGPKNGERYGAPLIEEEWEDDDDDEVALVPGDAGDEALTGVVAGDAVFVETIDPEQALTGLVAGDIAFVETADLEQKLDMGVSSESAGLPSNFYYGESSNCPEPSPEFIKDHKPLVGTVEISEPNNGQFFSMPEHYAEDITSVKDEANGELNHNGNPPSFNYALDDLYFDAMNYPLTGDGSFLETNDLVNPAEANLTGADPSGTDILDEYLTYFDADEDISQYISFDSPQNVESENPIPDQGPSFIQQNVDGETKDVSMPSKQDFEAHSSNEASFSKQNPQASKLESGNTFSFIQQANNLLGSIPAPPAFASEFPSKEVALQLQSAGQSSNSAHVTAGMIRISNVTLRGNEMDWMLGKNGELNFVISSGFSQPDVNSAALEPVSGLLSSKTAFVLSHGWVFLMCFSVLILSMSFKIGCFMYTGK